MPSLKTAVLVAGLAMGAMSLASQVGAHTLTIKNASANASLPVAQLVSLRLPDWQNPHVQYVALPRRSEHLNALLQQSVELLTRGTAVESRQRLMALEASLNESLTDLRRLRTDAALTPVNPCDSVGGGIFETISTITCRFEPSKADRLEALRDAEGTVKQRMAQISAERDRFAADLKAINLNVAPAQIDGLMNLATASDLVSLHAAYTNLANISGMLRKAMLDSGSAPMQAQRYYGIYVVLLEVAMHMHEEFFIKLRSQYLPRIDALTNDATTTYNRAQELLQATHRDDLKKQLQANIQSLGTTLKAAQLYKEALLQQASAVDASWRQLYEQHEVAVNSYRTANLSGALLDQMLDSGKGFATLRNLEIPALEAIGDAAVQRELGRLTSELQDRRS